MKFAYKIPHYDRSKILASDTEVDEDVENLPEMLEKVLQAWGEQGGPQSEQEAVIFDALPHLIQAIQDPSIDGHTNPAIQKMVMVLGPSEETQESGKKEAFAFLAPLVGEVAGALGADSLAGAAGGLAKKALPFVGRGAAFQMGEDAVSGGGESSAETQPVDDSGQSGTSAYASTRHEIQSDAGMLFYADKRYGEKHDPELEALRQQVITALNAWANDTDNHMDSLVNATWWSQLDNSKKAQTISELVLILQGIPEKYHTAINMMPNMAPVEESDSLPNNVPQPTDLKEAPASSQPEGNEVPGNLIPGALSSVKKEANFLDDATEAYIETALWASTDGDGTPLDRLAPSHEVNQEVWERAKSELARFIQENQENIEASGMSAGDVGHNFFLTRNGHGAGFWDRGLGDIGDQLTNAAHGYGEHDLLYPEDFNIPQPDFTPDDEEFMTHNGIRSSNWLKEMGIDWKQATNMPGLVTTPDASMSPVSGQNAFMQMQQPQDGQGQTVQTLVNQGLQNSTPVQPPDLLSQQQAQMQPSPAEQTQDAQANAGTMGADTSQEIYDQASHNLPSARSSAAISTIEKEMPASLVDVEAVGSNPEDIWKDSEGTPLQVGKSYKMTSNTYSVPDIVTVLNTQGDNLTVHISNQEGGFETKISNTPKEQYNFEKIGSSLSNREQKDLIDEEGIARNLDRLNLSYSHYEDEYPNFFSSIADFNDSSKPLSNLSILEEDHLLFM